MPHECRLATHSWALATDDVSPRHLDILLATPDCQRTASILLSHTARIAVSKAWLLTTTGSTAKSRAPLPAPAASWAASSIVWATASPALVEASATGALPSFLGFPHDLDGNPFSSCPRADSSLTFRISGTTRGWGDGVRGYGNGIKDATHASGRRAPTASNPLGLPGGSTQSAAILKSKTQGLTGGAKGSASNPLGLK